jgi:hypothetical protein
MVPAGYLLKRVSRPPGWLPTAGLVDICSVADCVNENVVDLQKVWRHNVYGVANDPRELWSLAALAEPDAAECTLFYYEAYEEEIESDGWTFDPGAWRPLSKIASGVEGDVAALPSLLALDLLGFDVVVFGDFLEHSPLSCNSVAEASRVNKHCLFDTLEDARAAIDSGLFGGGCEEGVYRIFSVSKVSHNSVDNRLSVEN